jgi:hypothetical protein
MEDLTGARACPPGAQKSWALVSAHEHQGDTRERLMPDERYENFHNLLTSLAIDLLPGGHPETNGHIW